MGFEHQVWKVSTIVNVVFIYVGIVRVVHNDWATEPLAVLGSQMGVIPGGVKSPDDISRKNHQPESAS